MMMVTTCKCIFIKINQCLLSEDDDHGDDGYKDLVDSGTANSGTGVVQGDKGEEEEEEQR